MNQDVDLNKETHIGREFPMSARNFATICDVAMKLTGIKLSDHKREMIYSRIARRTRPLNLSNFDEYCALIEQDSHPEHAEFVNAITTNLTSFFRESHHFEYLTETVLPWLREKNAATKRIRVWSAGCSTGEEPYSLAITLRDFFPVSSGWDIKILASDLDSNVVAKGASGVYDAERVEDVSDEHKKKYFMKNGDQVSMKPILKDMISFKQLNLLESWPMKGPFDFMFCRNVVIYFDKETQKKLFNRYADMMRPDGYICIGHSENLNKVSDRFESLGRTIYRRQS